MTLQETRRFRINQIEKVFVQAKKENKEIILKKLIAERSLEWGCNRRTILEYLKVLKDGGKI